MNAPACRYCQRLASQGLPGDLPNGLRPGCRCPECDALRAQDRAQGPDEEQKREVISEAFVLACTLLRAASYAVKAGRYAEAERASREALRLVENARALP